MSVIEMWCWCHWDKVSMSLECGVGVIGTWYWSRHDKVSIIGMQCQCHQDIVSVSVLSGGRRPRHGHSHVARYQDVI